MVDVKDVPQDEKDTFVCNIKALRMIRFSLQFDTFRLVSSCKTAKEVWDRLKELYSTDEDLEHSIQTLLLSEFGDFKQKPEEKLIQAFDRFNHFLSKMIKHGIERKVIEQKVTFMNGLRSEWMVVVSTVKADEQLKAYFLAKLVRILKSYEGTMTKETNVVSSMGSLALISKGKNAMKEEEDLDLSEFNLTNEEYALMVSNPKKFIRRNFPTNKNQNWQGNYSSEKAKEEPRITPQQEEPKKERKMSSDSGFNCHFCGGKNHFAKDCMLRKMLEKIESEDNEAYYLRKLEEIKKKKAAANNTMNDEEVRKPTHGRDFVAKEDECVAEAKCLMVTAGVSQMRGYITDGGQDEVKEREDRCFAAKHVGEQINEYDQLIKKNSVEFTRLSQNKSKVMKKRAVVYQKVETTPNQVCAVTDITQKQTAELTSLVNEDNDDGCEEHFWPAPIDNADETVGLSERTSWRVKGRYVA
ncbi:uncharacterized protein LOC111887420 [Lactuca sativa]|uniref:uncharacterized protein LOC111887420 n=1 Tax=Lactuca sativa TaxID=4236 RepID=UPI000CD9D43B|nr:uncharacterized protein LOC111887420 [Lactuca sativa]